MIKKILVLGGSKGIGEGCSQYFKKLGYSVTTVARTNADILGDINDTEFRNTLVKNTDFDIILNSIGRTGLPLTDALNTNFLSIADVISRFYYNLKIGSDIINISSLASVHNFGNNGIGLERISYNTSKNAISSFCISLARSRARDVRVATIEPDLVLPTSFNKFHKTVVDDENYNEYNFNNFTPLRPIDISKTVEWILEQPRWINVSRITLNNNYKIQNI